MIYNENGIIINEEYILEDYFNGSHINSIITESFKDSKFAKTVSELWSKFIEKVKQGIQWLVNIPNRAQIFANKKRIKDELHNFAKSDNKNVGIKFKGEVAKYIYSKGYKNGKWIETFKNACSALENDSNKSIDDIKNILYKDGSEDGWFTVENSSSEKINTDEIVDFALSVSSLSKPLKDAYNHLIKINKKENKISSEMINEISHYFTKAMSSIRNLSYACITVCMNALKGKTSDSIEGSQVLKSNNKNKKSEDPLISDAFKENVAKADKDSNHSNLLSVKVMLKNYTLMDESLQMFNACYEYAYKILGDRLIDKPNKDIFDKADDDIDEDYMFDVVSMLPNNFSKDRVNEVRRIFKILYPYADPYVKKSNNNENSIPDQFKKDVENANDDKKLNRIRRMLTDFAFEDKTLKKFNMYYDYAYKNLGDKLIQKHNGDKFKNKDELYDLVQNRRSEVIDYVDIFQKLKSNFSKERVDAMRMSFPIIYKGRR